MRFIRSEIQTPRRLVPQEKRHGLPFYLIVAGVVVLVIAVVAFFSAFYYQELIEARWDVPYRRMQTYALGVGGMGIILYVIGAIILEVPLRKTTYYKVQTIIKNEPFDPPRKGDFTKPIYMRLRDLDDDWAIFMEVNPPDTDFIIPQAIVGPGGVFTIHPLNQNPERRAFKDPGPDFEKACRKLGAALGTQVLPIILFSTNKLVMLYRDNFEPKTRVMHIREIFDYFDKRKNKLKEKQRLEIEEKMLSLIKGTPPG